MDLYSRRDLRLECRLLFQLRGFRQVSPFADGNCEFDLSRVQAVREACFFFSSRRRHTRLQGDWSSDVCSSDLYYVLRPGQQRSFGELIAAQPALPSATATTLDGAPLPLQSLKGQWLLLSVAGGADRKSVV